MRGGGERFLRDELHRVRRLVVTVGVALDGRPARDLLERDAVAITLGDDGLALSPHAADEREIARIGHGCSLLDGAAPINAALGTFTPRSIRPRARQSIVSSL